MQTMGNSNAELIETIERLGGKGDEQSDITFEGTRFIIPSGMTLQDAWTFLRDKIAEDGMRTTFSRRFHYREHDGAVCAMRAIKRAFGMSVQVPTAGMFKGEVNLPQLETIDTAYGVTEQVPSGAIILPMLPDAVLTFSRWIDEDFGAMFYVSVEAPKKMRHLVEGLFMLIQRELETASIYRGKAFDGSDTFIDLSGVNPERVTYSAEVMTQLEANVWSMLKHSAAMREHGISLKRSVLLEGPYGTGKTLAAFITAQIATANGWTFIYCRPGKDNLDAVMRTAQLYMPAVVFFEDIDIVSDVENKNTPDAISRLLDTFDGITAKGTELLAVMTTNHADRIHKGMVRPGRLDAVVHIDALDRHGLVTMMRNVIPADVLAVDDFDAVAEAMHGYMPAFVKEALERSLRYAIARGNGTADKIQTADIVHAADGLRAQHDLMLNATERKHVDPLSESLAAVMKEALEDDVEAIKEDIAVESENVQGKVDSEGSYIVRSVDDNAREMIDGTSMLNNDGDRMGGLDT